MIKEHNASSSKSLRTVHVLEKRSSPPVVEITVAILSVQFESSLENAKEASVSLGTIHSFLPTGAASRKDPKEASNNGGSFVKRSKRISSNPANNAILHTLQRAKRKLRYYIYKERIVSYAAEYC